MLFSKVECKECGHIRKVPSEKYPHKAELQCPVCKKQLIYNKNIVFDDHMRYPNIAAEDFMHPLDKTALQSLKTIPLLDMGTKLMMKYSYEKFIRITQLADNIKVTERTCSYIYHMINHAAGILGVPSPDVYINQNPMVNAYTTCVDEPVIVINSGLIELCDDEELFATIAHEMGHIKCEHVLYHMLGNFITQFPDFLGVAKLATSGFSFVLLQWSRKSELSADRAAFIVTKNKEKIISLLMKLAGGSSKLFNMIDYGDFLSQHSEWEKLMENTSDKLIEKLATMFRSHPFPIIRAKEIEEWPGLTVAEKDEDFSSDIQLRHCIGGSFA